tara:strand:- start:178 stop:486 length:309 start_codon:yes stop_codon:yes gene_type:complete
MKLTKSNLKQMIREELIREQNFDTSTGAPITDKGGAEDAKLTPEIAKKWLQKLENALGAAGFDDYEVLVIGHAARVAALEGKPFKLDPSNVQKIHQIIAKRG